MGARSLIIPFDEKPIAIAAHDEGDGQAILFLHGWLHSNEIWSRVTSELVSDYRVVTIDLPGFGETEALRRSQVSIAGYARIVLNIIREVSATYPLRAIVADSLSGVLAAHACGLDSTFSRTRLLISGCPFAGLPISMRIAPSSFFLARGLKYLGKIPPTLRDRLIRWSSAITMHDLNNFGPEIIRGVLSADPETAEILFDELKKPVPTTLSDALSRNRCIFLRGSFDRVAGETATKEWAARVGASYVELTRSAHTPMIEEPHEYAQAIRAIMLEN
jgi:pimeloyl-ACP methyl ester carboxylesterase